MNSINKSNGTYTTVQDAKKVWGERDEASKLLREKKIQGQAHKAKVPVATAPTPAIVAKQMFTKEDAESDSGDTVYQDAEEGTDNNNNASSSPQPAATITQNVKPFETEVAQPTTQNINPSVTENAQPTTQNVTPSAETENAQPSAAATIQIAKVVKKAKPKVEKATTSGGFISDMIALALRGCGKRKDDLKDQ